ncbi:hypothetical protein EV651_13114 [Kribbella sp. VKM Ac-2571]|nr:hypothetical protein EV651_13114 [Kribbella sp. VKM Ac-2571]
MVRSRQPAPPAIVPVETFTAAQLAQRKRKSGGKSSWSSVDRRRISRKRVYMYRGRIRCGICVRTMEGAARREDTIYGSATALAHPRQIYLREDLITPHVNRWIGRSRGPWTLPSRRS